MARHAILGDSPATRRILIVDDDDDARALLSAHFQRAGYDVTTAHDGNEGIAEALRTRPSVIILDLAMPGLDGWGAMRLLRAYATTAEIPLVAWTGLLDNRSAARSQGPGFDVVMKKPCSAEEVERVVDELVSRGRSRRPDAG